MNKNVRSYASPVVGLGLVVLLFSASVGQGQSDPQARRLLNRAERASGQMICSLSTFFSFDSADQVGDVLRTEGRGLATCKNDQGFSTEAPVYADIEARVTGDMSDAGEMSFSGTSAAFVVSRELGQIQDRYTVRPFSWTDRSAESPVVLFRGERHDLVVEMRLSSSTQALQKLEINSLRLRFDESAPDFQ